MHETTAPADQAPDATREPTDDELMASMTPAEVLAGPGIRELRRRWRIANGRDPQTGAPLPENAAPDHPGEADPEATGPAPEQTPKRRWISSWWERREVRHAHSRTPRSHASDRSPWAICGVVVLGLLVLAIVGVGLYTSLGALRDTALAAHIEPEAARLWWIGIDGLIVVAIVAAMILRHDPVARRYALGIVALFTAASGLLQFLHGLGWTAHAARSGDPGSLPWQVVAVIAVLVIGTIFCGTHLFVYALRHLFPRALADQRERPGTDAISGTGTASPDVTEPSSADSDIEDGSDETDRPSEPLLDPETEREIRKWFAACAVHLILDAGGKPTRSKIAGSFGIADRQAGYVIADVIADREEAAERQAQLDTTEAAGRPLPGRIGAVNGSGGGL